MARERIGEGFVEARLDTSRLRRDTSQMEQSLQQSMRRTGERMQRTGRTLSRRVTAPIAAMGAAVLRTAANFEQSMNRVGALTGATGDDFDRLSERAQELGRTTQFSASQAADAMGFLAMAGLETNEIYDAMPGVLDLAAAGQIELAQAADIASNVLTGMNMEVDELDHLVDVLAATTTSANVNMQQMGDSMAMVAPVAAAAGAEVEEIAAAIGLMGDAGIQGSTAGAALRMAISQLINPTGAAADVVERLGINALDAEGNLRPLDEIVGQLEDSGASAGDMMELFGQRAGPGMAALVSAGSDALSDFTGELQESAGTAEEIAERQMEGLSGALARFRSAAEGAGIAIAESGLLERASEFAELLATWFQRLAEVNPELLNAAVVVAGFAAATGPAVWAIGGMVSGFARLLPLINPYTIALAGAAAIAGHFIAQKAAARARVDELRESLDEATGAITENTEAIAMNRLQEEGAIEAARLLGISMQTLRDAALGTPSALDEVDRAIQAAFDERNQAGAGNVTQELALQAEAAARLQRVIGRELSPEIRQAMDEQREMAVATAEAEGQFLDLAHAIDSGLDPAMGRMALRHQEGKESTDDSTLSLAELEEQTGLTADEMREAGVDVDALAGDFDDLEGDVRGATSALSDHAEELRAQADPLFALHRAIGEVERAEREFIEVLEDSESTQRDVEEAALDLMGAQLELMGAAGDAAGEFDGTLDPAMRNSLELMGMTDDQLEIVEQAFADAASEGDQYAKDYEAQVRLENHRETMSRFREIERASMDAARNRTARITVEADVSRFNRAVASIGHGIMEPLASGGVAHAGDLHLVGEEGPEMFVPGMTGTVIDAERTARLMLEGPDLSGLSTVPTVDVAGGDGGGQPAFNFTAQIHTSDVKSGLREARHQARIASVEAAFG